MLNILKSNSKKLLNKEINPMTTDIIRTITNGLDYTVLDKDNGDSWMNYTIMIDNIIYTIGVALVILGPIKLVINSISINIKAD